jgi:uncharacterized membrane protein YdjX (TVP38/TMEM64 family)
MTSKNLKLIIISFYILLCALMFYLAFESGILNLKNPNIENLNTFLEKFNKFISNNWIIFFILSVLWVFFLGIALPVIILAVMNFDIMVAVLFVSFSFSIGVSLLYFVSKNILLKLFNFSEKKIFKKYMKIIKKRETLNYLIFRIIPGIPFPIKNILPIIIDMKYSKYILIFIIVEIPTIILNAYLYKSIYNGVTNYSNILESFFLNVYILIPFSIIILIYFLSKIYLKNIFKK